MIRLLVRPTVTSVSACGRTRRGVRCRGGRYAVTTAIGIAVVLCGCSHIATVSHHKAVYAPSSVANLVPANQYIASGQRLQGTQPMQALGNYLAAARISAAELKARPQNQDARQIYNYSVARCIDIIETGDLN